ncbi:hypothetical protein [Chitinophaga eiseniae]|uniref:DUF4440 domain-containing protein n=1 Tax=Chitinophaga eiseniae TaxID=634771 RepID=A0A847SV32_9BACT|nr:hypothetical protein [Chitinophaga eiseniae]NLR80522.1 hypothetical protein [Chitinophaga eiseniae]
MKVIIFTATILFCAFNVHAQQNKDDSKAMIDSAIAMMYAQFWETGKQQKNEYYLESLYLLNEQDQPLTYVPSSSKFKFINIYDDRNRKVLSKGIYAWKVLTALNKNKFVITIINFYITYKNRSYNFSNGGGSTTVFEYSCNEDQWKLLTFNNQGI